MEEITNKCFGRISACMESEKICPGNADCSAL